MSARRTVAASDGLQCVVEARPGGSLILPARFRGQEGAAPDAPMHSHLGVLGVTGFLMRDLNANPLVQADLQGIRQPLVDFKAGCQ